MAGSDLWPATKRKTQQSRMSIKMNWLLIATSIKLKGCKAFEFEGAAQRTTNPVNLFEAGHQSRTGSRWISCHGQAAMRENEKPTLLSRRQILASGVAMAGAIPFLPSTQASAVPEPRTANFILTAGTRTLAVNGKPARVFGLIGPNGKPGITLSPGERFQVDLVNQAGTSTLVHWHGQLPPWKQDGFPWPQTPPIPAGDTGSYDYAPIAGTYWMHSHQGMQEQSLMTAPLIVRSAEDVRADRQEVVLMLHDFSFHTPEQLLAGLTKSNGGQAAMPKGGMGNGMNMR